MYRMKCILRIELTLIYGLESIVCIVEICKRNRRHWNYILSGCIGIGILVCLFVMCIWAAEHVGIYIIGRYRSHTLR